MAIYSITWWGIGIAISKNSIKRFQIISTREILTISGVIFGLITAYFFIGLFNGLVSALFILFVNFIIGGSPYFYLLIYFMSAVIGLPMIYSLVRKINKNKVWTFFKLLACVSFMPVLFIKSWR